LVSKLTLFRQAQPNEAEGQDHAELGAPLGGAHVVWRERVWAFHVPAAISEEAYADEKPPDRALWDIRQDDWMVSHGVV
jgi:hypothetical protein